MSLKIEKETKVESDPCVVAWDERLIVGTEDGSIKTFDGNLSATASWSAHDVQPFGLASGGGHIYSSSNDGGIKVWTAQGEKVTELPKCEGDIGVLHVFGNDVFAGDEVGNYNVLEEVKDLWWEKPFLFTVRDLDVTATEIKPGESKTRFVTRHTMEGRAPVRINGNRLLVMGRGGNELHLHDASIDTSFKKLHSVKASEMIVTSMAVSGDFVWTAGWDKHLKRWKISGDTLQMAGDIGLGACVNGVVAPAEDSAYVILAGGKIVHIKAA